jgi:hypothetical protein
MHSLHRAFSVAFATIVSAKASFADVPRETPIGAPSHAEPLSAARAESRGASGDASGKVPVQRFLATEPVAPAMSAVDSEQARNAVNAESDGDYRRTPAFEVNVLWPFFPGGIVDLKGLFPVVNADRRDFRGEIIGGLHSDFGWGPVTRPVDKYGKVSILAAKVGYRQFLVYGTHVEASVNLGWRHEEENIYDGGRLDAFIGRLWLFAGYQHEISTRVYVNVRGGGGVHLFRTDRFADTERKFAPAGDANLGVRF